MKQKWESTLDFLPLAENEKPGSPPGKGFSYKPNYQKKGQKTMENERHPMDIAEKFSEVTGTNKKALEDAIYVLHTYASNAYEHEYWKELYKALSALTEKIERAENDADFYTNKAKAGGSGSDYLDGKAVALYEFLTPDNAE